MLFAMAFLVNFLIGGVTGLYLADVPTDAIFHSNMFVAAHFHFTLVGGAVFGFLGAFDYWFPKMTGRQLDQRLGRAHFWLMEVGFLGTFLPLFLAGVRGEPRWQAYISPNVATINLISSLFAIMIVASVAVFAYNFLSSWIAGKRALANQWGSRTLEWTRPEPAAADQLLAPGVGHGRPLRLRARRHPHDGGRMTLAGASDDAAVVEPASLHAGSRPEQVRLGTILMILSDVIFVLALLLGWIYLHGLNTPGPVPHLRRGGARDRRQRDRRRSSGDRRARVPLGPGRPSTGQEGRVRAGATLAWVISLAALAGDLVVFADLKFATPFHAYASGIELFVLYHAFHLLIALIAGGLALGRLLKGRLAGREYVMSAVGYWYWWVAVMAVALTVVMATVK